jgi:hypothetical protein
MDTARPLKVPWRQVLYVLVGHGMPSYDLLLASFFDFCKRSTEDIRGTAAAMTVRLFLELEQRDFEFPIHKQRERSVAHKAGEVRQQTRNTPDQETCTPALSIQ